MALFKLYRTHIFHTFIPLLSRQPLFLNPRLCLLVNNKILGETQLFLTKEELEASCNEANNWF